MIRFRGSHRPPILFRGQFLTKLTWVSMAAPESDCGTVLQHYLLRIGGLSILKRHQMSGF